MNRPTRRFLHTSLGLCSVVAFIGASYPRLVAWSESSNAHLIATTRAASCLVTKHPLTPNAVATDEQGKPLVAGRYLCYWDGTTAQTGKNGVIGFIRSGQPEQIASILESRGFRK
jgi:hypothetical protein